jgi:chemotaxis protein MotB
MARRKRHIEHENHERWLVSYADFITLLFAFFVVMFASSQANKSKAKQVSDSVREAFQHGEMSAAISVVLGRGKHEVEKQPEKADPKTSIEKPPPQTPQPQQHPQPPQRPPPADLNKVLAKELSSGKVQVRLDSRGLVISLREAAFFASGDDVVSPDSLPILVKIAAAIRDLPNGVRLEGHSDSIPIHNARFRSNWELSAARATTMLELLRDKCALDTSRFSVAGYAENAPVDTNDTEEGRAHNRRVDLVVLSAEGEKAEPQSLR